MDMIPPQNMLPASQVKIIEYNSDWDDEFEFTHFLYLIDEAGIPITVKQFARDNNCKGLEKNYYWSEKLYKNEGGVYVCGRNGKAQYIIDNGKKLRFAKWWETYKFRHNIFLE